MSPELIAAVKERLELGHTVDAISDELRSAGHSDSVIIQVSQVIKTGQATNSIPLAANSTEKENGTQAASENQLPSATSLFGSSFSFIQNRVDILLLLAAPFSIVFILSTLLESSALMQESTVTLYVGLLGIGALIAYILILGSSLYIISESSNRKVSFTEAFTWAKKSVLGLLWIYVLTALVVYGGLLLFIIPAIVVSLLIYFSQFVYVKEGVRGLDALLRSRDLVKGNWWAIAGRLLVVGLLFIVVFVTLGIVLSLIAGLSGDSLGSDTIFAALLQVIGAAISLMGLKIGMDLYQSLASARPFVPNSEPTAGKWKYVLLAILGLVFGALILLALIKTTDSENDYERDATLELQRNLDNKERAAELRDVQQVEIIDIESPNILPQEEPIQ